MKEYFLERGELVNRTILERPFICSEKFQEVHSSVTLVTQDVSIFYNGGFLLLERDNFPEKKSWWPVGGLVYRGVPLIESLKRKVKEECNLEISRIKEIGFGRTVFKTDPFGHGRGTDTISIMYYAKGSGEVKLDALHSDYKIVNLDEYRAIKGSLHPYVQNIMDMSFTLVQS